jgi:hypothetical protein
MARTTTTRSRVALAGAAAALAIMAAGSASPALALPAGKITGPGGKAVKTLFARVNRAYRQVPAVELTVIPRDSTIRTPRRFVLILRSGQVAAEEFTRAGRDGTTLVATSSGRTYSRPAGARCWRRLSATNPERLTDVGTLFPDPRIGIKVLPPQTMSTGLIVKSENRAEFWFLALQPKRPAHLLDYDHLPLKRFINYMIDTRSHRLKSIYIQQSSPEPGNFRPHATLKTTALATAPKLPRLTPACYKTMSSSGLPPVSR